MADNVRRKRIAIAKVDAAVTLAGLDGEVWYDIGDKLTCREAEVLAAFLTAWGTDSRGLMQGHAEGDDEGDRHYLDADGNVQYRTEEDS